MTAHTGRTADGKYVRKEMYFTSATPCFFHGYESYTLTCTYIQEEGIYYDANVL